MLSMSFESHAAARRVISAALEIDQIDHSTQYATVRYNGRAFATISRARVYAKSGKAWSVHDTSGALLFEANFAIEFANDAFRRRLISIIQEREKLASQNAPGAPDLSGEAELIALASAAAAPATSICTYAELTGYEQRELAFRGWPRGNGERYEVKRKYDQDSGEMSLVRFIRNPARDALTRAVNRSIAAGNPVFVNMPAVETAKPVFDLAGLSAMQIGRLNIALDKQMRFSDGIRTIRAEIERMAAAGQIVKTEGDGMIDWSRTKFNRMDYREQREYEARLKAKRYYYLNNWQVPKIVFDAVSAA